MARAGASGDGNHSVSGGGIDLAISIKRVPKTGGLMEGPCQPL